MSNAVANCAAMLAPAAFKSIQGPSNCTVTGGMGSDRQTTTIVFQKPLQEDLGVVPPRSRVVGAFERLGHHSRLSGSSAIQHKLNT